MRREKEGSTAMALSEVLNPISVVSGRFRSIRLQTPQLGGASENGKNRNIRPRFTIESKL